MAIRAHHDELVDPAGIRWQVHRVWAPEDRRRRAHWRGSRAADLLANVPTTDAWTPDGGGDLAAVILLPIAVLVIALVLVPLLLFGLELIVIGCVLAAGIVGRLTVAAPWTVEARQLDPPHRVLTWRVKGWRASGRRVAQVRRDLENGDEPTR